MGWDLKLRSSQNDSKGFFNPNSKIISILLVLTMAFLIFAGPTYVSFFLSEILNLDYIVTMAIGLSLFLLGLILLYFLVKNKIITK